MHLDTLSGQGWQPGELRAILLDLLTTNDPRRHQVYARRVIALLAERGYTRPDDAWHAKVDRALAWDF